MCFQDWRIGRLIRSVPVPFDPASLSVITLPSNQCRVGLTVSPMRQPGSGIAGLFPALINFVAPDGSIYDSELFVGNEPYHMTIATHGDLTTRSMVITWLDSVSNQGGVIEYIAPEWLLTMGLEELSREFPKLAKPIQLHYPNPANVIHGN